MIKVHKPRIHRLTAGLALLSAAWLSPGSFAQSPDFHIYLGLGQSNMEGGPSVSGLAAANARMQVLSAVNCPNLNPARTMGKWYAGNPPLTRCSAGPGIVDWFGRTLVDSLPTNVKVGFLMLTVLGTKIELFDKEGYQAYLAGLPADQDWLRNLAKDYGSNPYARLIEMAKLAQKDGVIRGILLHQGESNAGDNQWPAKVKKIYDDIIKDLSLDPKNVPLLAGEVVNADEGGTAAGANTQIAKLPGVLPNSYVISSSKLPDGGDNLHFSAASLKTFGQRYASTMLSILNKPTAARPGDRPQPGFAMGTGRTAARQSSAEIDFEIPERTFVSLKIYGPGGREVAELAGREFSAGRHTLEFDRQTLPRGICILGMKAGAFAAARLFISDRL